MLKKLALCAIAALSLSACTAYNGTYAAISNKPISLYDITRDSGRVAIDVKEQSDRTIAIIIPFDDAPTIEEAVNLALKKYNGDYLENATIEHKGFHVLWLYHYSAWSIHGNVMRIYR